MKRDGRDAKSRMSQEGLKMTLSIETLISKGKVKESWLLILENSFIKCDSILWKDIFSTRVMVRKDSRINVFYWDFNQEKKIYLSADADSLRTYQLRLFNSWKDQYSELIMEIIDYILPLNIYINTETEIRYNFVKYSYILNIYFIWNRVKKSNVSTE